MKWLELRGELVETDLETPGHVLDLITSVVALPREALL